MRNSVVSCLAMCVMLSNVFMLAMDRNQGPVCVVERWERTKISSHWLAPVQRAYYPQISATTPADHRTTPPTQQTPADHRTSPPTKQTPAEHGTTPPKGKTPRDEDPLSPSASSVSNDSLGGSQRSWVFEQTSPCKRGMQQQRLSMEELSVLAVLHPNLHLLRQSGDFSCITEHATNGSPRHPTPKTPGK